MADLPAPVGSTTRASRRFITARMAASWLGRSAVQPKRLRAARRNVIEFVSSFIEGRRYPTTSTPKPSPMDRLS
ncbi:hypothetical protein GCM10027614_75490 [Micromonospora vulcania]